MRIVQIVLLVLALVYLLLLHNQNPATLSMPFMISLPPALVILIALALGWLAGWGGARLGGWRQGREMKAKQRQIDELQLRIDDMEQHRPNFDDRAAVIPDRSGADAQPSDR
jgi:uncharacterized integral membrane protein